MLRCRCFDSPLPSPLTLTRCFARIEFRGFSYYNVILNDLMTLLLRSTYAHTPCDNLTITTRPEAATAVTTTKTKQHHVIQLNIRLSLYSHKTPTIWRMYLDQERIFLYINWLNWNLLITNYFTKSELFRQKYQQILIKHKDEGKTFICIFIFVQLSFSDVLSLSLSLYRSVEFQCQHQVALYYRKHLFN